MNLFSRIKQIKRVKLLVGALVVSFVVVTIMSLQLFMHKLLEREAFVVGMRWASNVESSLNDLDQIYAGKAGSAESNNILNLISSAGQIYRYEFMDNEGTVVFSKNSKPFSSPTANENSATPENHHTALAHGTHPVAHQSAQVEHESHDIGSSVSDTAHMLASGKATHDETHGKHENHAGGHSVVIHTGDGIDHPLNFAKVQHPISSKSKTLGSVAIYMDLTETQALLRDTMFSLFFVLAGMTVIGFGLPGIFYLRGRSAANKANAKAQFYAKHDAMTQLLNRRSFTTAVDRILDKTNETSQNHALHFIDTDNFKPVNDTYGHDTGDELLRQISSQLRAGISLEHTIARIGGDEFAVFQRNAGDNENIKLFAEDLQKIFSGAYMANGHAVNVTASIGTAVAQRDGATCKALMKCADIALYAVKDTGRNGQKLFDPAMKKIQDERAELEAALRNAEKDGKFELHFQPLFLSGSSKLSGFEALIRMRGKDGNLIPPDSFISVAEEMGLMENIGSWVIREATRIASSWPSDLMVAVNLSITQFESGNLTNCVADALAESGLDPQRLELEITEGLILKNTDWNIAQLYELKKLGTTIAMDDFGTGYSSLGYLWRFPFDKIKIDRSFLQGFDSDMGKVREIIQTIIALGHSLDMRVTAEGVETEDQMQMLRELDCDLLQGFYLGKPFPSEQIAPYLLNGVLDDVVVDAEVIEPSVKATSNGR